jgi:hypothetical protein
MVFTLLPMVLVAVVVLVWAWFETVCDVRAANLIGRRRTIAMVGLLASTALVPLPYGMVFLLDPHSDKELAWSLGIAVLLFVLSLTGAFMQKILLRIGLILCSLFFLGYAGFIYAISGWQF